MADGGRAERDQAIRAFLAASGWGAAERRLLAGDASFRRYDRLTADGRRAVLMDAPPPQENVRPFIAVARLLRGMGLSAPEVLAADEAQGLVLLEDLGDDTYTRLLDRGAEPGGLYRPAVDLLIALQRRRPAGLDALPALDDARCLREVSLILDWYWPAMLGGPAPEPARASFLAAWRRALPLGRRVPEGFAHFDFHVDNLIWLEGRSGIAACGLLDFQDAVRAPLSFDLMSLLQDARRDLDPALSAELYERYLAGFPELDRAAFADAFAVFGAERHTRILGTFTRLLKRDGKPGYLVHMPRVWRQLETALARPVLAPVRDWFERHLPRHLRGAPRA
jgi:aminoglycoside/choline kinase family phosphotransferase